MCGSTRTGSVNHKILRIAMDGVREAGGEVTEVDLRDYDMPIYNGDLEQAEGLPEAAVRLREVFKAHDGLLLATPEYNGGMAPLPKNAIDWVSRPYKDEPNVAAIAGKTVAVISAANGVLGGARSQIAWRTSFQVMQCVLVPQTVNVPHAAGAFNEDGSLKDENIQNMTRLVGRKLVELASARS